MSLPAPSTDTGTDKGAPISADDAVTALADYAALSLHDGVVYGVRYEPHSGRNRLCRFQEGQAQSLLPERFSVRSRVHEYGGGAWCRGGTRWLFVNDEDQQIWQLDAGATEPSRVTTHLNTRFADLHWDRHRHRLIAVSEQHGGCDSHAERAHASDEPINRLVAIDLQGQLTVLAEGADFYSSPALSPDGRYLAWIEWDHPQQPWRGTRLCRVALDRAGRAGSRQLLSDIDAAWAQPRFSRNGVLHAVVDRDNWWRIERYDGVRFVPLPGAAPERTEFTTAPWQFGLATYGWSDDGTLYATGQRDGYSTLYRYRSACWEPLTLTLPATRLHALCSDGERLACVAECADRLPAVLMLHPAPDANTRPDCTLVQGGEQPTTRISVPRLCRIRLPHAATTDIPCFLYRPQPSGDDRPRPLLIWLHGGPTAATAPVYRPAIQYWTQRGFMVADVNYRGSTGFGRDYRLQLAGQWGRADVEDVEAVARQLIEQGLADPEAIFIRGNSAGGYTTLAALAHSALFVGGASLYGVSDPARLNAVTHKFESRYLHWLIADPAIDPARYRQRSPLHNAAAIRVPVIFFQGEKDRVVLPEQTRQMVAQLRENGVEVEAHYFADEGHGFRKAGNQARVLAREWAFYRRLMGQVLPRARMIGIKRSGNSGPLASS